MNGYIVWDDMNATFQNLTDVISGTIVEYSAQSSSTSGIRTTNTASSVSAYADTPTALCETCIGGVCAAGVCVCYIFLSCLRNF